jgi:hypothetical protein
MTTSNPPMCGVHNVTLVQHKFPIDPNAPHLGSITGYMCQRSGQLVEDTVRTLETTATPKKKFVYTSLREVLE